MDWFFEKMYAASATPQPPAPPSPLFDEPWRKINWTEKEKMKNDVRELKVSNSNVGVLHLLVHGPAGAGKSSFINSIDSIFQNRMTSGAICDNTSAHSFTKMYQSHRIKDGRYGAYLPFTISDSMGLEGGNEGMQRQDLTKSLKGFIKDGYMLDKDESCSEKDAGFNHSPTLDDQIHCLVSVIPATSAKMIDQDIFEKMRHVRCKATEMKIPQVALLTKVDNCSEEVKKDIQSVYKSKKIKAQMEVCSNRLGVPMNFIFPVKNYHEEIDLDNDIDVLLLSALTRILNIANDHVDQLPQDTHT